MSEQSTPAADVSAWLTGQGADAYALVWVADGDDLLEAGKITLLRGEGRHPCHAGAA